MTTLARYRECFEECGVKLPGGLSLGDENVMQTTSDGTHRLHTQAALAVCQCAALKWILEQPSVVALEFLASGAVMLDTAAALQGFDDLVTACYAVAGAKEASR